MFFKLCPGCYKRLESGLRLKVIERGKNQIRYCHIDCLEKTKERMHVIEVGKVERVELG